MKRSLQTLIMTVFLMILSVIILNIINDVIVTTLEQLLYATYYI